MRRAAEDYQSTEDVVALEAMIEQMSKATESASRAIADALVFVAESNQRIKKLEAGAKRAAA